MKSTHDTSTGPQQRDTTSGYRILVGPRSFDLSVTVITATILLAILGFMVVL